MLTASLLTAACPSGALSSPAGAIGTGVFVPHPTGPSFGADESWGVALGDLDGDGDVDAVVANDLARPRRCG